MLVSYSQSTELYKMLAVVSEAAPYNSNLYPITNTVSSLINMNVHIIFNAILNKKQRVLLLDELHRIPSQI
jgi:hypothetical protein